GQVVAAHQQHAAEQAEQGGQSGGGEQAQDRVDAEVLGQQRSTVGAKPEEGGMTERDDAGITEDQVQRDREQHQDGEFVQQQETARQDKGRTDSDRPEHELKPAEPSPVTSGGTQGLGRGKGFINPLRHYFFPTLENRPSGFHI